MPVRLVLTDVDGCISPEDSSPWDGRHFEEFAALSRKASAGEIPLAPLTLCTGRPQPYVEVLMKMLDIRYPAICEVGAVFYSLHDNRSRLAPGITPEMLRSMHRLREHIMEEIIPKVPGLVYQFGKEAQMSLFSYDPSCFPKIIRQLEEYARILPGLELTIMPSQLYLNINFKGITKGAAIEQLLEELNLRREETAGVGDTMGDLSIREAVGFFACPANAVEGIKEVADYVSPYPEILGMLDILQRPELQRLNF